MCLRVKASLLAILVSVSWVPLSANAAVDVYMKVDGIVGDVVVIGHLGEIALESYTQTFGAESLASGRNPSSPQNCSRVVVSKFLDSASPSLITYAVGSVTIPNIVISIERAGERPGIFFKATLGTVLIERIELTDEGGALLEQIILKPRNIRIEFREQRPDGSLDEPIVTDLLCT